MSTMEKGLSIYENGIGRTGARRCDEEARCGERANVGEWVGDVPATAVEAPASAAILPPAPLIAVTGARSNTDSSDER